MGKTWAILQFFSDGQDSEAAGEIEEMRITTQKQNVFSTEDGVLLGQVCCSQS